jgi:hypothetical protein
VPHPDFAPANHEAILAQSATGCNAHRFDG